MVQISQPILRPRRIGRRPRSLRRPVDRCSAHRAHYRRATKCSSMDTQNSGRNPRHLRARGLVCGPRNATHEPHDGQLVDVAVPDGAGTNPLHPVSAGSRQDRIPSDGRDTSCSRYMASIGGASREMERGAHRPKRFRRSAGIRARPPHVPNALRRRGRSNSIANCLLRCLGPPSYHASRSRFSWISCSPALTYARCILHVACNCIRIDVSSHTITTSYERLSLMTPLQ